MGEWSRSRQAQERIDQIVRDLRAGEAAPALPEEAQRQQAGSIDDFLVAEKIANDETRRRVAGEVLVMTRDGTTPVSELMTVIGDATRGNGLVAEAWEAEFAARLHRVAAQLPEVQGRALLVHSGYESADLDELALEASEAVSEAYRELYGEPDDEYDDAEYEEEA